MSAPLVSILMSMKNSAKYVGQTIASIRAQTFGDWEFVINDNASSDRGVEIVEAAAGLDSRIVLLRNDRDLGYSGGLNHGLRHCRGTWIARIDSDDIAMPNRLERQLAFVTENPDVAVTSCLAHFVDVKGRRIGKTVVEIRTREDFQRYFRNNLAIGILHPGALMRRDVLTELDGYRTAYSPADDIDLWCRVSDRHLILVQPEYLMEYRIHPASISSNSYAHARLKHLWARDSMVARRCGKPEPTWVEFLTERRQAAWPLRLNRWRKMHAKRFYRQAGLHSFSRNRIRSCAEMFLAALLQPEYTVRRFTHQVLR